MTSPVLSTLHTLRCATHQVIALSVQRKKRKINLAACSALHSSALHLHNTPAPSKDLHCTNVYALVLQVTCSARGHCNYATGLCQCDVGWEGSACERLACPVTGSGVTAKTCNGRGACLTMAAAAARYNGRNLVRPYVSYTTPWDAHKIQVCCYSFL
jgi:EGF-like domain